MSIFAKARAIAGVFAAITGLVMAQPALANTAANADVTAPLREQQAAKPAVQAGDEEYRRLFNGWKALDNGSMVMTRAPIATAPIQFAVPSRVSIPSRMPVEGAALTSGYGMRWHPVLGGRRQHKGVDLAEPMGTPVYATADGAISRAEWFSSYGLYISIEHGGNIQTRYGHLSRLNVAAGQIVHKGDLIGFVGTTGRSTGPHLHYEVRIAGTAVNPVPYLQGGVTAALPASEAELAQGSGDEEE